MGNGEDMGEWESGPCELECDDEEEIRLLKEHQLLLMEQVPQDAA